MTNARGDRQRDFRDDARTLASAWLALLTLMLISLGSAYLRLGVGNLLVGLAIASVKTALVVWWFMTLRRASTMTRIAAAVGVATLLLLMTLSLTDYATRVVVPARWQAPRQIAPLLSTPRTGTVAVKAGMVIARSGMSAHTEVCLRALN